MGCCIVDLAIPSRGAMSRPDGSTGESLVGCGCLGGATLCPCSLHPTPLLVCVQGAQAEVFLRTPEAQEPGRRSREVERRVDCFLGCCIVDFPVRSWGAVSRPAWVKTQKTCMGWLSVRSCPLRLQPAPGAIVSLWAGDSGWVLAETT